MLPAWKSRNLRIHLPTERMSRLRNVNRTELFNAFSNNSRNNLSKVQKHPAERIIRLTVYAIALIGTLLMMREITQEFLESPTVTTAEINPYPTQKVDFPAVAVCSINRISRRAATIMADELMDFETTRIANLTTSELLEMLRYMGYLYSFGLNPAHIEKIKLLDTILERGYNGYDVTRIMRRLTPKCRYLLKRCSWEGKDRTCNEIFFFRRTENGHCCVFNYVRQNDGFGTSDNNYFSLQQTERSEKIGSEYGLSVLLNPQLEDYVAPTLISSGFKVQIYLSSDYPDSTSGGMREIIISPRTETFLDLNAVTFYSVPDVIQYNIHKRDCIFSSEESTIFQGHYSFSDCILYCRTKDILELCKCVPFFYPTGADTAFAKVCNLKDLPCLNKYNDKWLRLKPRYEENMVEFDERMYKNTTGYLNCGCLPSCADTSYRVSTSSIPLTVSEISWGRSRFTIQNHSIMHIYFGTPSVVRLRQDVHLYWYGLMSNLGGICSFFLGFSVITLVEIIYKVTSVLCASKSSTSAPITKMNESQRNTTEQDNENADSKFSKFEKENQIEKTPKLYWNEIIINTSHKKFNSKNVLSEHVFLE